MKIARSLSCFGLATALAVALFGLLVFAASNAQADLRSLADGDLDPTFGNGGIVTTTLPFTPTKMGFANSKVWVAGWTSDSRLSLAFLDSSGNISTQLAISPPFNIRVEDFAVQPNGKMVMVGSVPTGTAKTCPPFGCERSSGAIVRLNADGQVDTAFGSSGFVTREVGGLLAITHFDSVVLRSDGSIFIAGDTYQFQDPYDITEGFLIHYDAKGSYVKTSAVTHVGTALLASNDDVAVFGLVYPLCKGIPGPLCAITFNLSRFPSSGAPSVESSEIVTYKQGIIREPTVRAAAQPNGGIIIGGTAFAAGNKVLLRYLPNGLLDIAFGNNGVMTNVIASSVVASQRDNKIIALDTLSSTQILVRYTATGTVDMSFGSNGYVNLPFASGGLVMTQPDGKIVVAGTAPCNSGSCVVLARYMGLPPPVYPFNIRLPLVIQMD